MEQLEALLLGRHDALLDSVESRLHLGQVLGAHRVEVRDILRVQQRLLEHGVDESHRHRCVRVGVVDDAVNELVALCEQRRRLVLDVVLLDERRSVLDELRLNGLDARLFIYLL